ncbi:UDP-glucose/GDP-mannose dehydrogenase family protein [Massilia sp. W12]|uniref:UDP-glucose dehydrogenase family protein n=1 Tax=Massilia sp. W12 TaxID=3126507 RepID=UPI0030CE7617
MKITMIGSGYVGLVSGACLAEVGNHVLCLDLDQAKIDMLNQGGIPIHEPGLDELVKRNRAAGRLQFTTDIEAAVAHGQLQFIAVGTPPDEDGSADLKYVLAAARNIARHMQEYKVIVNKSTVPVGSGDRVHEAIAAELAGRGVEIPFTVVSNPEFLKEGAAIKDFSEPDRVVIGIDAGAHADKARQWMKNLYAPFNREHDLVCWMDRRSAELTKYAANAMLATRISFMNELARLAELVDADIEAVRHGIGKDRRIGESFLHAGCGYGGSCFPKDVQALARTAQDFGSKLQILQAVEEVNHQQKYILPAKVTQHFGDDLRGHQFALWGLAFKPDTDDMREASARVLLRELVQRGARVRVYDPVAMDLARTVLAQDLAQWGGLQQIEFAADPMAALDDAQALLIVTEWNVFRSPDFEDMARRMAQRVIFDGRNLFDPEEVSAAGFTYYGIGRSRRKAA